MLIEMVREKGHAWKEIAKEMNIRFENEDMEHRFGRTPENVKDKFKQLGGSHLEVRKRGPWTLEEGLQLLELI